MVEINQRGWLCLPESRTWWFIWFVLNSTLQGRRRKPCIFFLLFKEGGGVCALVVDNCLHLACLTSNCLLLWSASASFPAKSLSTFTTRPRRWSSRLKHMGDFTQGGEWLFKNVIIFLYGETNISLKINIDTKQPTFMYQLRFSRGPHDLFFRTFNCWTCQKHLVNLAKK